MSNPPQETTAELKSKLKKCEDELSSYRRNVPSWRARAIFAGIMCTLTLLMLGASFFFLFLSELADIKMIHIGFFGVSASVWSVVLLGSFWFLRKLR